MIIGAVKDALLNESRAALTPGAVARLVKRGAQVLVEKGLGASLRLADDDFIRNGARVAGREEVLAQSDILLRVRKPSFDEISRMKSGVLHVSFLDPFNEKELIDLLAQKNISAVSLEMIPRTTLAQKMDALSSQANLAGYVAVVLAAERLNRILPMMMTPAGTISPARVFVVGAGVAGLQAIATAKRLGARVDAFDTRPVVKEQVQSLGAKFVEVDLGETGQTRDGYARALTPEQLAMQREGMARVCAQSDIVITTAQIFGRKAPVIITRDMVSRMKPGSIIVDLAVETGGNVEGVVLNEEIDINGVKIMGLANLPGHVAVHASEMFASNLVNFIEHFWNKESGCFDLRLEDEIIKGCLITHAGKIIRKV